MRQRREQMRERERATTAAVRRYLAAWQSITLCETERDDKIAELRRQIGVVENAADARIVQLRAEQAAAARTIRDQPGHTDDDVANLLEITPKQVRQLLALARAEQPQPSAAHPRAAIAVSDSEAPSGDPGVPLQSGDRSARTNGGGGGGEEGSLVPGGSAGSSPDYLGEGGRSAGTARDNSVRHG
ncbi:hypothetical protein [Nocardia higoensis]|uniref:hypothetical protein n=1 Tax=Nocardia higoensis TaxID=228599 RepID=UPI0012F6BD0B|nr:hypothetical protein [Nocardia higoensis]